MFTLFFSLASATVCLRKAFLFMRVLLKYILNFLYNNNLFLYNNNNNLFWNHATKYYTVKCTK